MGKSYKIISNTDNLTGQKLYEGEIVIDSTNDLTKKENSGLMVILLAGKLRELGHHITSSHINADNLVVIESRLEDEPDEADKEPKRLPDEIPPEHFDTPQGDLGYLPKNYSPPKH